MEEKKRRLPNSIVNAEFLENKKYIGEMIEKGHSINYIHKLLFEDNKITMRYPSLLKITKKYFQINCPKPMTKVQSCAEFIKNKEFISQKVKEGYSINHIHYLLTKDNKISMGYPAFLKIAKEHFTLNYPRVTSKVKNNDPNE